METIFGQSTKFDFRQPSSTVSTVVYYHDEHTSAALRCNDEYVKEHKVKWVKPSTWPALAMELERGCKYLAFHVDMISKLSHATANEFIDAIKTLVNFIPNSKDLKVGVVVTPTTPLAVIRDLQKSGVQGLLLDINYYRVDEVQVGINAFVNDIPYWPKHIINELPGAEANLKCNQKNKITLTARQNQVLTLIKERGASNKVIAKALGITESTVKLHVTMIFKKYGVRNRTQLALFSE